MEKSRLPDCVASDLLDRLQARFQGFGVIQGWGLEILEMAPGRARLRIRANPRTSNPGGDIINGGVLAALGDMSSALALSTAFDGAMPFVTSDLSIRYLEPARRPSRREPARRLCAAPIRPGQRSGRSPRQWG
jgi:uncharacterized protein (TIGR00369 family)